MERIKLMIEFLNVLNGTRRAVVYGCDVDLEEVKVQTINQIKKELEIGDELLTKKQVIERLVK